MWIIFTILCSLTVITKVECGSQIVVGINEDWVCNVKNTCLECLRLSQCTWCLTKSKCFSERLRSFKGFCKNDTIVVKDYGLSIDGNADCACTKGDLEQNCLPPGVTDAPACSGRGTCECGRCVCDPTPDPEHPTKAVIGEFCEFDNFSCDGPDCDEGPYPLSPPEDENEELTSNIDWGFNLQNK